MSQKHICSKVLKSFEECEMRICATAATLAVGDIEA